MPSKIRITETRVYEYTPDYGEEVYQEAGIKDIESALEFDKDEVWDGKVGPGELCKDLPKVSYIWEIVNE